MNKGSLTEAIKNKLFNLKLINNIVNYIIKHVKNFGYFEYAETHIETKQENKILLETQRKFYLEKKLYPHLLKDASWFKYYDLLNTQFFKIYFKHNHINSIDYFLSIILRFIFKYFSILLLLFKIRDRKINLFIKKFENNSNKKHFFITIAQGKKRFFETYQNLDINYLDIAFSNKNIYEDYQKINHIRLNFFSKIECINLILKFKYIDPKNAIKIVVYKKLLEKFFKESNFNKKEVAIYSREGVNADTSILYSLGVKFNIKVINSCMELFFNKFFKLRNDIDINILNFSVKKASFENKFKNIHYLKDYPYLNWRKLHLNQPKKHKIGLLLGDQWNRYFMQEEIDYKIINTINKLNIPCTLRPHPQELSKLDRKNYYDKIGNKFDLIKIEKNQSLEKFLQSITILITYNRSTVVDEAALCGKKVLIFQKNNSINNIEIVNNLPKIVQICENESELLLQIEQHVKIKTFDYYQIWKKSIASVGININLDKTDKVLSKKIFN